METYRNEFMNAIHMLKDLYDNLNAEKDIGAEITEIAKLLRNIVSLANIGKMKTSITLNFIEDNIKTYFFETQKQEIISGYLEDPFDTNNIDKLQSLLYQQKQLGGNSQQIADSRSQLHLTFDDLLDLYLMNHPVPPQPIRRRRRVRQPPSPMYQRMISIFALILGAFMIQVFLQALERPRGGRRSRRSGKKLRKTKWTRKRKVMLY